MVKLFVLLFSVGTVGFSSKNATPLLFPETPDLFSKETLVVLPVDSLKKFAENFNQLVLKIRDGKSEKVKAKKEAGVLLAHIKQQYLLLHLKSSSQKIFPVKDYNAKAIGGTNGEGYKPGSYNFYDGNKHTGHPAHDIFVYDQDQNCLDDRTGKPVTILSVSEGIVVAIEPNWEASSALRGGIYVMVYNPLEEILYYYAHNKKLIVTPGTIVKAGTKLGELGRSGLNANKKRSPTHLHLMVLKVKPGGNLVPVDLYAVLKGMK